MGIIDEIKKLCTPAYVYLLLAVISNVAFMIKYNQHYTDYCRGKKMCLLESVVALLLGEFFIAFLWLLIIQWMCNKGLPAISWILVALPYTSLLLYISYLVYKGEKKDREKYHLDEDTDLDDIEPF